MSNGLATASMVIGIVGMVFCWVPFLGFILGILALILGIVALSRCNRDPKLEGKGMAIAGIALGGVATFIGLFVFIGAIAYFGVLDSNKLIPERTVFPASIPNVDNAEVSVSGSNTIFSIAFRNAEGARISIPANSAKVIFLSPTGAACSSVTNEALSGVAAGDMFVLNITCSGVARPARTRIKAEISFDYLDSGTGLTVQHKGSVDSKY
jgi:hypothetical protein